MSTDIKKPIQRQPSNISETIDACLENSGLDANAQAAVKKTLLLNIESHLNTHHLRERLAIMFEYERNYLELIKTYKEELKFVSSLQEDLRKERSKFFAETLGKVSTALKDSVVDDQASNRWILELVASYTRSLDLSEKLVSEETSETVGSIRTQAKQEISQLKGHEPAAD